MHLCVSVYTYFCVCVLPVCLCLCVSKHIHMSVYIYISVCRCLCVCIYVYTWYVCMYVLCLCMSVCPSVYSFRCFPFCSRDPCDIKQSLFEDLRQPLGLEKDLKADTAPHCGVLQMAHKTQTESLTQSHSKQEISLSWMLPNSFREKPRTSMAAKPKAPISLLIPC